MALKSKIPEILESLPAELQAALTAAAELVVEDAKNRVPVSTIAHEHLRDAIHVEEQADGVAVVAGDNTAWYGHIIEHGSVNMPPRPFLIPALEDNRAAIIEATRVAVARTTE